MGKTLYSPNRREGTFSEIGLPVKVILGNSRSYWTNKRAGAVGPRPSPPGFLLSVMRVARNVEITARRYHDLASSCWETLLDGARIGPIDRRSAAVSTLCSERRHCTDRNHRHHKCRYRKNHNEALHKR